MLARRHEAVLTDFARQGWISADRVKEPRHGAGG